MSLSFVLAGGGTAGHVNPLLSTALALRERGGAVRAVGTSEGLEADLVPEAGVELSTIVRVPFPRRPDMDMLRFPVRYRRAVAQATEILGKAGADAVIGFGGYASTPVYRAAKALGIPVVVHEQNAKPGLANRYGARFAEAVALTFDSTPLAARAGVTQTVGLPLRPAIADLARTRARGADAPRLRAAERFGLDPDLPTLLVTGGSLGALHLNDVLTSGLPAIRRAGVQILHLTGRGKDGAVRAALREAGGYGRYRVVDYLRGMEEAYAAADLVLCRSGAGTVAELCALGLPGFFVPLPIGNGEQERNAADVVAAGGAALVRDRDFDLTAFERDVLPLVGDAARLEAMAAASRGLGHVDAAERLADLAVRIGGEKG